MNIAEIFRDNHRNHFKFLDYAVIGIILLNLVALIITNILVVKATPDIVFHEANPFQAAINGYKAKFPNLFPAFMALFRQILLWAFIIGYYVWKRFTCDSYDKLILLTAIVCAVLGAVTFDTFGNLGYYVGVLLK